MNVLQATKLVHELSELLYCTVYLDKVGHYRYTEAHKKLAATLVEVFTKAL